MEVNKLMIGDFVYKTYPKKHIVEWCYLEMFDSFGRPIVGLDIEPIPLTAEILEKNGFHPLYDDKSAYKLFWSDEKEENYWSITIDLTHPIASRIENHIMRTGKKSESWEMRGCVYFVHELQHLMRQFRIDKGIEL